MFANEASSTNFLSSLFVLFRTIILSSFDTYRVHKHSRVYCSSDELRVSQLQHRISDSVASDRSIELPSSLAVEDSDVPDASDGE